MYISMYIYIYVYTYIYILYRYTGAVLLCQHLVHHLELSPVARQPTSVGCRVKGVG